uniref:LAGLIDADG endonuclease n=1 Tax=Cutaneotrichosporon cutaneum TaxID=5554 RepID=UPI00226CB17D|nr:LAGLIDADG endonuclease [Cutaneotrichosporon cutaneum]UZC57739.1 LAGLIDADG endonuclease [Cutaneotrichosporon cutaneum]
MMAINRIKDYLENLPHRFEYSSKVTNINVNVNINKRTSVCTLSINNVDTLFNNLLFLLMNIPFQTQKGIDFYYWALALYLHKMEYYYLKEGRNLLVIIRNYINDNRYSNNPIKPFTPTIETIKAVLRLNLPIQLTPTMSQTDLAKRYARLVPNRNVYVYDNNVLIKGSPFQSYRDALKAIGKPRTGSRVKRNIDTGKLYLNRYAFYSSLKS